MTKDAIFSSNYVSGTILSLSGHFTADIRDLTTSISTYLMAPVVTTFQPLTKDASLDSGVHFNICVCVLCFIKTSYSEPFCNSFSESISVLGNSFCIVFISSIFWSDWKKRTILPVSASTNVTLCYWQTPAAFEGIVRVSGDWGVVTCTSSTRHS